MAMDEIKDLVLQYEDALEKADPRSEDLFNRIVLLARDERSANEVYSSLKYQGKLSYSAGLRDYISHYAEVIGPDEVNRIVSGLESYANKIKSEGKKRLLFFNATYTAGGVAEMVPCMRHILSLFDIELEWHIIRPSFPRFYEITKKMHDIIQGANQVVADDEWLMLKRVGEENFRLFKNLFNQSDVQGIFFEDPQVLGLFEQAVNARQKGIIRRDLVFTYRLHIDVSGVSQHHKGAIDIWNWIKYLISQLKEKEKAMFQPYCVPADIKTDMRVIEEPPGVDPLSPKNKHISKEEMLDILPKLKEKEMKGRPIPTDRPSFVIGARLDGWKGLFEAFLAAVDIIKGHSEFNIILFGNVAPDAPDGMLIYKQIRELLSSDEGKEFADRIYFVNTPVGREVSALYKIAALNHMPYIACSLKEGYNLMVIEAVMQDALILVSSAGGLKRYKDLGYKWVVDYPDELSEIKDPSHIGPDLRAKLVRAIKYKLREYVEAFKQDGFPKEYCETANQLRRSAYHSSLLTMTRDYLRYVCSYGSGR